MIGLTILAVVVSTIFLGFVVFLAGLLIACYRFAERTDVKIGVSAAVAFVVLLLLGIVLTILHI